MTEQNLQGTQRLWLVRHGTTQWNSEQRFCGHSDLPLSLEGRRQAQWLARRLHSEQITTIYSSDLLRAQQTAEIIAAHCPQPVRIRVSTAWRELAFGDWEGLTYAQIAQQFASHLGFFADPVHNSPPGGESFSDLVQRIQKAFVELACTAAEECAQGKGGAAVLVSHGGPLRALLCSLLALPLERQWQLRLDHGSLSAIDFLLPLEGTGTIMATLALLNVQRPTRLKRVPTAQASEHSLTGQRLEGPMRHV